MPSVLTLLITAFLLSEEGEREGIRERGGGLTKNFNLLGEGGLIREGGLLERWGLIRAFVVYSCQIPSQNVYNLGIKAAYKLTSVSG